MMHSVELRPAFSLVRTCGAIINHSLQAPEDYTQLHLPIELQQLLQTENRINYRSLELGAYGMTQYE